MGQALRSAGVIPARERLDALLHDLVLAPKSTWFVQEQVSDPTQAARLRETAMNAIRSNPRNWDGARDALYKAIRNDAALLWELFEPFRLQAVQKALTEAASKVREEELERVHPLQSGGGGHRVAAPHTTGAPSARARTSGGIAAAGNVARLSLLDTFRANGIPIGDMTAREAVAWAKSHERDTRFVRLLVEGLPEDMPIRKFRTPEEAQKLYALATEAGNE